MFNRIIIIGSNHHNTFSMVKSFGRAGYTVDVLVFGCNSSYISQSKYVNHICFLMSLDQLLEKLLEYNDVSKPIIVSCADGVSQLLDEHYNELYTKFHFFNCGEQGRLTHYLNKKVQTAIAEQTCLTVPHTIVYTPNYIPDFYPCLLKPVESTKGGKHIEICHDREEFREKITDFSNHTSVLVQSFIEREEEIVIVGLSLGEEVIIPNGFIHKIRESAGGTSYSKVCKFEEEQNILATRCKKMVRSMNYVGLFGVEFIKSQDGTYYFIEINLRNDATTFSFVVAGVNLPLIYAMCCDGKSPLNFSLDVKELFSIVDFRDLENAMHMNVSFGKWLREYKKAECKYFKDNDDKRPYRMCLKSFIVAHVLHKLRLK